MYVIKWTNKWSNEQGFVGSVSSKNRCFHNSDAAGAKKYASEKAALKAVHTLEEYGEADNNHLEVIPVA